mgnify:CR=1 FL=1|jgi:hypothetical protein
MEYKLIAMDMDGTLLNSSKDVSERTIKAIERAKNKGTHVVLATGRVLKSAQHYADKLKLKNYIIASNGAIVINGDNEIVYSQPLDFDRINMILNIGDKYNIYSHFYDEEALYTNKYVNEIVDYYLGREPDFKINIFDNLDEIIQNNNLNVYKFLFLDNEPQKLIRLSEELKAVENINITKSFRNNLEVMDINASKGQALEYLGNKLNIPRESIIAVGDNENDLSMLNYAGLGIAMGNGEDIVRKSADYVTLDNDNDGVASVIEKFIL